MHLWSRFMVHKLPHITTCVFHISRMRNSLGQWFILIQEFCYCLNLKQEEDPPPLFMQSQLLYNPFTPITEMRSPLRICSFLPTSALSQAGAHTFAHGRTHTHAHSVIWLFRKTECKIAISVVQLLAILQFNLHPSLPPPLLEIITFATGKKDEQVGGRKDKDRSE